jgi:U2-associated protein SR140
LDAFEGEDVGRRKDGANFVKASGDPQSHHAASLKASSDASSRPSRVAMDHGRAVSCSIQYDALVSKLTQVKPSPPSSSAPKPKGKRAMDAFLEEIKRFSVTSRLTIYVDSDFR